jgi:hypothetical protein
MTHLSQLTSAVFCSSNSLPGMRALDGYGAGASPLRQIGKPGLDWRRDVRGSRPGDACLDSRNGGVLACQRPDHLDQLAWLIRLAEKKPTLRHFLIANSHLARRKHKVDWWPTVTNGVRKS